MSTTDTSASTSTCMQTCGKILRGIYALGATIYSVFAVLEFAYVEFSGVCDMGFDSRMKEYLWVRFWLSLAQIPVHMGIVFAARYFPDAAMYVTTKLGCGDFEKGKWLWYLLMNIGCNLGLAGMTFYGCYVLNEVWGTIPEFLQSLEIASIITIGTILFFRLIAIILGKVKDWFYLAWPTTA